MYIIVSRKNLSFDNTEPVMVLLYGNSLTGAHVKRNLCYSTCLRHLISSRVATNRIFYPKRHILLHACATCNELPSNISTMGLSESGSVDDDGGVF